jgi:hypothetical protein
MPLTVAIVLGALAFTGAVRTEAQTRELPDIVRGAERIVVGRVAAVSPRFATNEYGDRLIVSDVRIQVEEVLKGRADASLVMELEGGQIGDLRLEVSDLPEMAAGDRAVFFLRSGPSGKALPHARGQGIKRIDARGQISSENVTIGEIRRLVGAQR